MYFSIALVVSLAAGASALIGQDQAAVKAVLTKFTIERAGGGTDTIEAQTLAIGRDYFQAQQLPLLSGRSCTESDTRNSPLVAIVSESIAARVWPQVDTIGHRLKVGGPDSKSSWMTVIGVAADSKARPTEVKAAPHVYTCSSQSTR